MTKQTRSFNELEKTSEFQEELLLLKAQTLIYQLLERQKFDQAYLAKKLGQSEAHVSALLSGKRNLTLRTLARICYLLESQVNLEVSPVSHVTESISAPTAGISQGVLLTLVKPYRYSDESVSSEVQASSELNLYAIKQFA